MSETVAEFFDSFGRAPNVIFERYLNRHCWYWTFSDRRLQSIVSRFCGHYCIYYCMLSSRGIDMRRIVSSLTSDTGLMTCLCMDLYVKVNKRLLE